MKESNDTFIPPAQLYRKALDSLCAQHNIGWDVWSDEVRTEIAESRRRIKGWSFLGCTMLDHLDEVLTSLILQHGLIRLKASSSYAPNTL